MTATNDRTEYRLPRALRPFHHREYRFLIASMAISLFASGMWIVALVWQVIAMGGTPSELSVVATATSLGLLVSILLGGVAADRLPRRALLIVVEAVRVGTAAVVGLLAVTGQLQLWQLAVVAFVVGAAEAFFFPAYTALLPTLLPPDELLAATGWRARCARWPRTHSGPRWPARSSAPSYPASRCWSPGASTQSPCSRWSRCTLFPSRG